jgi:hypothetical protein
MLNVEDHAYLDGVNSEKGHGADIWCGASFDLNHN